VNDPAVLQREPLEGSDQVPRKIIEQARRSSHALVLSDALEHPELGRDPYVLAHRVRSALALPLLHQGKLAGVLYLENNLATRLFAPDRVDLLQLLSSQIATSLQNSQLFERLTSEIEDRKRAEAAAREAVQVRDDFLSIASHELNTPITSLRLMVDALEQQAIGASPETLGRAVGIISRQTRRLRSLIADLLDVAHIQSGQIPLRPEELDLGGLVREAVERFGPDLAVARCQLDLEAPAGDGQVVGHWDRARLDQVVSNLLSNAIKFGQGKPIEVSVRREGSAARLVVADHGIGIPPERLPHIFGRFERAVSPSNYGGLGLGLYIVHQIVRALGGTVSVASTVAVGSTFTVELPLAVSRGPRTASSSPSPS
jgi:signal transduction histidine kinase